MVSGVDGTDLKILAFRYRGPYKPPNLGIVPSTLKPLKLGGIIWLHISRTSRLRLSHISPIQWDLNQSDSSDGLLATQIAQSPRLGPAHAGDDARHGQLVCLIEGQASIRHVLRVDRWAGKLIETDAENQKPCSSTLEKGPPPWLAACLFYGDLSQFSRVTCFKHSRNGLEAGQLEGV